MKPETVARASELLRYRIINKCVQRMLGLCLDLPVVVDSE